MTILVTSDLHLNNLPRDEYRHTFQQELRRIIEKNRVTTILILGDLTDEKDFHSAQLVNRVVGHIYELAQFAPVFVLKGNHDYTAINETPFFAFLHRVEGVRWIDRPQGGFSFRNLPAASATALQKVMFLPHSPNPERDWKSVKLQGWDFIFAHNTFDGTVSDGGRILSGTPTSIFPKDARVISGDVHTPQKNGPVTYVGSPYRIDFGDSFEPRVLLIYPDKKIQPVMCDGPRKELIEVEAGELIKLQTKKILDKLAPGDILKVRVKIETHQYARWAELKRDIENWAIKHKFVVHLIQPVTERAGTSAKKASPRKPVKADAEIVKQFAARNNVDKETTKIGLEFIDVS